MIELFAIKQDPSNPQNWGIIWETSGTEGGFDSEEAARAAARKQLGTEAEPEDSKTWEW